MAPISQREARRLQMRVWELQTAFEEQRRNWSQAYFGGTEITRAIWQPLDSVPVAVRTARKLNHAVVAIAQDDGVVRFVALPHPQV